MTPSACMLSAIRSIFLYALKAQSCLTFSTSSVESVMNVLFKATWQNLNNQPVILITDQCDFCVISLIKLSSGSPTVTKCISFICFLCSSLSLEGLISGCLGHLLLSSSHDGPTHHLSHKSDDLHPLVAISTGFSSVGQYNHLTFISSPFSLIFVHDYS